MMYKHLQVSRTNIVVLCFLFSDGLSLLVEQYTPLFDTPPPNSI